MPEDLTLRNNPHPTPQTLQFYNKYFKIKISAYFCLDKIRYEILILSGTGASVFHLFKAIWF